MAHDKTPDIYSPDLSEILDLVSVRIFWKDKDLRYLGCNQKFADDAGCGSPSEIVGKTDFELAWSRNAELYRSDDARVIETGTLKTSYEEPQQVNGQEEKWLLTSKQPLKIEGEIVGVVGTYDDITTQRAARVMAEKKCQLEAIGVMVTGIAHDFNNLLTPITSYSELVCSRLPDDEESMRYSAELEKSIGMARALSSEILAFTNEVPRPGFTICPNALLQNLLPLLRNVVAPDVGIVFRLCSPSVQCLIHPVSLERVLVNLVKNANDAMPEGGEVVISTAVHNEFPPEAMAENQVAGKPCFQISVTDTGTGIPQALMGRVFDPFVSKKCSFRTGSGLGLAICKDIVSKAGGVILATRDLERGAEFRIYLPLTSCNTTS